MTNAHPFLLLLLGAGALAAMPGSPLSPASALACIEPAALAGEQGAAAACDAAQMGHVACPAQATHQYGVASSAGVRSATLLGGGARGAGASFVTDSNVADCDGDGVPGDWDGDYDLGTGVAFFGYGQWAEDPDCDYGLNVHGPNVVVNDAAYGLGLGFVVVEVSQQGPTKVPVDDDGDGTPEGYVCETEGVFNPTSPNGCVSRRFVGTGHTCGAGGGDGGYWVVLDGFFVDENGGFPTMGPSPTVGTVTAH